MSNANAEQTASAILSGILAYVVRCQASETASFLRLCPGMAASGAKGPTVSVELGKRYARVIVSTEGTDSRSVHSFVDMGTGAILKAASWKAPAKGIRGSVLA